jgi:hypothetical protein
MLPSPAWRRRCLAIHRPLAESHVPGPSRPTPPGAAAAICGRVGRLWTVTSAREQHLAGSLQQSITRLVQFSSGGRLEVVGSPPRHVPETCRWMRPGDWLSPSSTTPTSPCPSPNRSHTRRVAGARARTLRRSPLGCGPEAVLAIAAGTQRPRASLTSRWRAQASATGPRCRSLSGLATERTVWICPPSRSSANVKATLPSRSRRIAPG